MSGKYALVVTTNNRYIPGVTGIVSSLEYYGSDVECHVLYFLAPGEEALIRDAICSKSSPTVILHNLADSLWRVPGKNFVWHLKFIRYLYSACLDNYDAVATFDADMLITSDITPYFQVAECSGKILAPGYLFSRDRALSGYYYDYFSRPPGTGGSPLSTSAVFFAPAIYREYFERVPEIGDRYKVSDMSAFNWMLLSNRLLHRVIDLPDGLWNLLHYYSLVLEWTEVARENHLVNAATEECICSVHGKWWFRWFRERKSQGPDRPGEFPSVNHNINQIWKAVTFFNFERNPVIRNAWDYSLWGNPEEFLPEATYAVALSGGKQ